MKTRNPDFTADALGAQGAWLRRLAASLVRDPALADDLAQEAWESALRHPPRVPQAIRGWLRTVLQNRLRNAARGEARRRAREQVVGEAAAAVANPEEVMARLQLGRRVATLVESLNEKQRQVVYLRFMEDRSTPEIARLLRIPEGTVRWRLKMALDELRARLDAEHGGDRARWRALLTPLAGAPVTTGPAGDGAGTSPDRSLRPGWPRTAPWPFLAAGGMAVVVALVLARSTPPPMAHSSDRAAALAAIAERLLGRQLPRFVATPTAGTDDLGHCPELQPIQEELVLRQRELEEVEDLNVMFERSAPNPVAEQRFGSALAAVLRAPERCPYTLECRGRVCLARILVPQTAPNEGRHAEWCFPLSRARMAPLTSPLVWSPEDHESPAVALRNHLDERRPYVPASDSSVRDAVSGQSFVKHLYHFRVAQPTGDELPLKKRRAWTPFDLAVAPGRHRPFSAPPATRSPACRHEFVRLCRALEDVLARSDHRLSLDETYKSNITNPGLVAEVEQELGRLTGLAVKPFPLVVECRGFVCALTPRDPESQATRIELACKDRERSTGCSFDAESDGWFPRLWRAIPRNSVFSRVVWPGSRWPARPIYVSIRSPGDRSRPDPWSVACDFGQRVDRANVIETCAREWPAQGGLALSFGIPDPARSVRRITVVASGALASTPFGTCVLTGVRAIAEEFEVPETRSGARLVTDLRFPGARTLWDERSNPCAPPSP